MSQAASENDTPVEAEDLVASRARALIVMHVLHHHRRRNVQIAYRITTAAENARSRIGGRIRRNVFFKGNVRRAC